MMRTAFNLVARCAITAVLLVAALASAQVPVLSGAWTFRPLANTSNGTPAGRGWVDIIYDPVVHRPVMFGGSGNTYMNDILQIDFAGGRWVEVEPYTASVTPSTPPCPRDEHAVEYDSLNRLYWSFGGSGFACSTRTSTVGAGSTGNQVVDPSLPAVAVDFYKDWLVTIQAVVPFYAYVTAYNPATKQLTLDRPFVGNPVGLTYSVRPQGGGGTWYYDPATRIWRSFDNPTSGYTGPRPISRLSPAMAYSIADEAVVMFGGSIYNDTWIIDAQTKSWLQMRGDGWAGNPPRRAQITNSMVYDAGNDVFVLFGGRCAEGAGCGAVANNGKLGDTWIYRLAANTWTQVTPAASPPARDQQTLSYDPVLGVVVLYGGSSVTGALLSDVWYYHVPSNTWRQVTLPAGPVARRIHAMVYDPGISQHVVFGGADGTGASLWDTWTLRLSSSGSNIAPLAAFSVSPGSGTPTTTFQFNASGSSDPDGSIASYAWTFGDGASGTGVTPTHQYATAGTYTVTLTVTDNQGAVGTSTTQVGVTPVGTTGAFANSGFEAPVLPANGYQYQPISAGWTFSAFAGIQRNGSAWGAAPATQGVQTAFLQGGNAQLSQTVNLATGTYSVTFMAARRPYQGNAQPVQFSVDGVNIGTPISPASTAWSAHTTATFTVAAGDHLLRFTSTNPNGDNTIFVDAVTLNTSGTPASTTTTLASSIPNAVVGTSVTFTATVTGSAPTGNVGFTSDGVAIAGCTAIPLSGSGSARTAMCSTSELAIGTRGIVAAYGGDAANLGSTSATLTIVIDPASGPTLANPGFEAPTLSVNGYQYQPASAGWTFSATAGIQRNGSPWGAPAAPQGVQTGFLQGANAQIAQTVSLPAGTYSLSFLAARRAWQGQGQPLQLSVDGINIGAPILPASTAFGSYTTATFTVTAGDHVLRFTSSNANGDNTSFIDAVTINVGGAPTPVSTTTTLASSAPSAIVGSSVTFTASVTGSSPTGSVSFSTDGIAIPGCVAVALSGSGNVRTAACATAGLAAGTRSIVATYSGDAANLGSTSATLAIVIDPLLGPTLVNPGFETPALSANGYQYLPTGTGWTFSATTGIQRNGSAWQAATAPQGVQTAFLQGGGAQLSQSVELAAGTYTLSFAAARRAYQGAGQPLQIAIDGVNVGTPINPASTAFATYTSAPFTVPTGTHTLRFTTTNFSGDNSTFLDSVSLNVVSLD